MKGLWNGDKEALKGLAHAKIIKKIADFILAS